MKNLILLFPALLLLAGCKLPASAASDEMQAAPQAVFTASALTAEAQRVLAVSQTPGPTPTQTRPLPTPAELLLQPTITLPLTVTRIATLTAIAATPVAQDRAEFIADVTVPDGTALQPGETFIKTWRLQNTGETTWTSDYKVVFMDGDLMDGPRTANLPEDTLPGQDLDVSMDFVAPSQAGNYRGYWKLQNPDGGIFGVGIDSAEAFWVDIVVENSSAPGDGSSTPTAVTTLASVSMEVDEDTYTGSCPHTYVFTVRFVLNKPATVTFNLEADNDAGADMKLPPPVTRNLETGEHSARFELTFIQSFKGWARVRFTAPENLASNRVNFELTCQ